MTDSTIIYTITDEAPALATASFLPIVKAVIALAHGLGIEVVAEGIETAAQLARLRTLVCDRGQGFFYARPMPAAELGPMLLAGVAPEADPAASGRPRT